MMRVEVIMMKPETRLAKEFDPREYDLVQNSQDKEAIEEYLRARSWGVRNVHCQSARMGIMTEVWGSYRYLILENTLLHRIK